MKEIIDEMIDCNATVTKSIAFPFLLLLTIDTYGKIKNFSRTKIVIDALREYIKTHNVEKFIKANK